MFPKAKEMDLTSSWNAQICFEITSISSVVILDV